MKTYGLGKEEKLLTSIEFKGALSRGSGSSTEHFKILICPNNLMQRRLGITASRKVGSAAKRNRVKRLLREFFRLNKLRLPPSSDILFIAKPVADTLDYDGLRGELDILMTQPARIRNGQ
jgi:ribonuclease P protein component